nr:hypothetical protein [Fodinicola feengrottensis]
MAECSSPCRAYSSPPEFPKILPVQFMLVTLAIIGIAELFRRSAPVLCLAVGTAAFLADLAAGPSLAVPLIFTDVLYAATVYGPRKLSRPLLVGVSALTVLAAAVTLVFTHDPSAAVLIPLQLGLVLVVPVLTGFDIRRHRDLAAAERGRSHELARLAELDRQAAITAERSRMARELARRDRQPPVGDFHPVDRGALGAGPGHRGGPRGAPGDPAQQQRRAGRDEGDGLPAAGLRQRGLLGADPTDRRRAETAGSGAYGRRRGDSEGHW